MGNFLILGRLLTGEETSLDPVEYSTTSTYLINELLLLPMLNSEQGSRILSDTIHYSRSYGWLLGRVPLISSYRNFLGISGPILATLPTPRKLLSLTTLSTSGRLSKKYTFWLLRLIHAALFFTRPYNVLLDSFLHSSRISICLPPK